MVQSPEAKISIFDSSFRDGMSCFDSTGIWHRKIWRLEDHIDRIFRSAKYLGIEVPMSKAELNEICINTARANVETGNPANHLRITITEGSKTMMANVDNDAFVSQPEKPDVIVYATQWNIPQAWYVRGMKLKTSALRRTPHECQEPKAKLSPYVNIHLAAKEAKAFGCDAGLLLDIRGFVAEATGANFFIVVNGAVLTPPFNDALPGLGARTVFEVCKELGIKTAQQDITLYDVYNAEESFLTGSTSGVRPVVEVDARKIGNGVPGPIAKLLHQKFTEFCDRTGTKF